MLKDVAWVGSSKADLSAFPSKARVDMGYQIHLVQTGQKADDWKPLKSLGKGILGVDAQSDKDLIVARYREVKERLS
ncbi:hypothetical protein [Marinobacter sp. LV10MA510-1]|uniref:hypothetical protein n=1 Tax=Marinobacter sp. LV10MA510-1 TaxID=1415567 RepID=UPI000BF97F80|nr:hypothetical protein [Marinobacter sp. LV10MA510-1]PFG09222.1 phage-related protein [Marinobacter sp. LV10MA510-1]